MIQTKNVLRCSLLNINGLNEASLANVETVVGAEKPDIIFLLETKRRISMCLAIQYMKQGDLTMQVIVMVVALLSTQS